MRRGCVSSSVVSNTVLPAAASPAKCSSEVYWPVAKALGAAAYTSAHRSAGDERADRNRSWRANKFCVARRPCRRFGLRYGVDCERRVNRPYISYCFSRGTSRFTYIVFFLKSTHSRLMFLLARASHRAISHVAVRNAVLPQVFVFLLFFC